MKTMIKFVFACLAGIVVIVLGIFFLYNSKQDMTIDELLQDYIEDYKINEQTEDGTQTISIKAPDFVQILSQNMNEFDYETISVTELANLVEDNSDLVKEYTIEVENLDEEHIKEALLSQISYDLLVESILESKEVGNVE